MSWNKMKKYIKRKWFRAWLRK